MPSGVLRIISVTPSGTIDVDVLTMSRDEYGNLVEADPAKIARVIAKRQADGGTIVKADARASDLPNERVGQSTKFRNQWRWDGAKIEPDLPLCRVQLLAEMRVERDERLVTTDGRAMRALDRGQPDTNLADYRQALRDLPASETARLDALDNAVDLEAHAVEWPTEQE